jgi:hypothetical protein
MEVVVCPHCEKRNSPVHHTCACGERLSGIPAVSRASLSPQTPRATADAPPPPSPSPARAPQAESSGMESMGWILFLLGVVGVLIGLAAPTTVPSGGTYGEVHNIGMIARNLGIVIASGFAAVSGLLMVGIGKASERAAQP